MLNMSFLQVCTDKGSGFHFGAITCESCKAFFRRRAQKVAEPCAYTNNCKMDPINRKYCVDCRLKKCLEIGMKKELILGRCCFSSTTSD